MYTIGKFAQQRGKWRVNNAGWNSDVDYFQPSQRNKPLIAIIGDSYIEALQVNVDDSMVSVLRSKIQSQYDVYGFGISGAPLSQYLQISRYVVKHFAPDVLIFNIVQYDLEESVLSKASEPYFLGIDMSNGKPKESALAATPVTAKKTTKLVFQSAILRYLWHNLRLGESWTRLSGKRNANANTITDNPETDAKIYEAADYIMQKLVEENPRKPHVFLVDAPRRDIYSGREMSRDLRWMHKVVADLVKRYHFLLVDLSEPFREQYSKQKIRFDSDYDYHWNSDGHKYAAEVLYRKLIEFGIVEENQQP
jgi:hypothetical protein